MASTPGADCRGRPAQYISAETAALMTDEEKRDVLRRNEPLERECGARPVTP